MVFLNIYVILSKDTTARVTNVSKSIHYLKTLCDKCDVTTKIHTICQPLPKDIEGNLKEFESRIKLKAIDVEPFKNQSKPLNLYELSNFECHRLAYKSINNYVESSEEASLHLILEDDVHFLPLMEGAWLDFLKMPFLSMWSMLMVGAAGQLQTSTPLELIPFHELPFKILPSKEAYFVTKEVAKELYDFTEVIYFDMRHTLSYWIHQFGEKYTVLYPNKRMCFEGSKLGLFPSLIHPNNILMYNHEYMELLKQLQDPTQRNLAKAKTLYETIQKLKSPDAMHLYAVLLYQCNEHELADLLFKEAITEMVAQKGLITRQSELLQNAINFYQKTHHLSSLSITQQPSKYVNQFKTYSLSSSGTSSKG